MKLLAIDTSTDYLSLALMDGETTLGRIHKKAPRSHSSLLVPMVDRLLKDARVKPAALDGFCIGVGPGSFTGLRIGVTTVKGLSYALGKPIVAVPTFDAIARNAARRRGIICPVLDARKGKVYACVYRSDGKDVKRLSKYLLLPLTELLKMLGEYDTVFVLGDFAERLIAEYPKAILAVKNWYPKPEVVGRLGSSLFKKKKFVTARALEPLYLYSRECDITGF